MGSYEEELAEAQYAQELAWHEIQQEYSGNPLAGKIKKVSFVSTSNGKGRKKRKKYREVELVGYAGRFHTLKDHPTGRLDRLAEEVISQDSVPVNTTPYRFFVDCFRQLNVSRRG